MRLFKRLWKSVGQLKRGSEDLEVDGAVIAGGSSYEDVCGNSLIIAEVGVHERKRARGACRSIISTCCARSP